MPICSKCGAEKEYVLFFKKSGRENISSYCLDCHNAKNRQWYSKTDNRYHLEKVKELQNKLYIEQKDLLEKLKQVSCVDCNNSYDSSVMTFYLKDDRIKDRELCRMVGKWSTQKLLEETTKYIVLCSNCNKLRKASKKDK